MLKKFGADLIKIRESKKITINDISAKTRVHKSILEKMEGGDFSFFTTTHIRAFLKQYAKVVGIDGDELLFNYEMAKNGKYTSMVKDIEDKEREKDLEAQKVKYVEEPAAPEEIIISGKNKSENLDDIFEIPKNAEKQGLASEPVKLNNIIEPQNQSERKKFSKSKRIKIENDKGDFDGNYYKDSGFRISSSFFKNAGIFLLVIALLAGVYFLVDVIFLKKNSSKTDIIRQNFDDVVKETEKKILGKRSDEEIQDSVNRAIVRADSLKQIETDSISLKIVGLNKGSLTVVIDTLLEDNKYKEYFKEGEKGEWKAKNLFYISSDNTEAFDVFLNGRKIKIDDKKIRRLKVSKHGIVK
ncbi:MAG: helix-turn-helix transcriptional regulator [Ignavibacteriae bacterium]|nr:helix-turn-helix transcriptional regulator [Ignavibacteriota bacterium]